MKYFLKCYGNIELNGTIPQGSLLMTKCMGKCCLVEVEVKTFRTDLEVNMDLTKFEKDGLNQLNEIDEKFVVVVHHTSVIQQKQSKWHDRFIKKNMFHEGD